MSRVYFTDRDLGKRFPDILTSVGLTVERHHDLFLADGTDEQWLEHCGKNGRIAISHNQRIRYTPNELAAVIRHSVALLIVIGKVPLPDLGHNFVTSLARIETFLDRHEPPYIAKVYRPSAAVLKRKPT
ncbi:MAG TPA: hypothetical protein VJN91_06155, partial [Gammaproteobacteria bacterium]|nr:hypothetical protein [Gammaproteobacteria bacterium]